MSKVLLTTDDIEEADNHCAFCGNPIVNSGEQIMVISAYRTIFNGTDSGLLEPIEGMVPEVAHQDCWEARNSFAPARRRRLDISGGF